MKALVLRAEVVRGDGLGRRLGFPTANLKVPRAKVPPFGVYRVKVRGPGLPPRLAACSVGVRPTLRGARGLRVEVHIPGFRGDLYGKTLEVAFVGKIRDEMRFPSLEALKARIQQDVRSLSRRWTKGRETSTIGR